MYQKGRELKIPSEANEHLTPHNFVNKVKSMKLVLTGTIHVDEQAGNGPNEKFGNPGTETIKEPLHILTFN